MTDALTFFKCYLIGIGGNLALGPIFTLTLKRSLRVGWLSGLATALAAACADGALFALGMFGGLSIIERVPLLRPLLLIIGGGIMMGLGIKTLREAHHASTMPIRLIALPTLMITTFFFTLLNPGTILYFMTTSVGVLGDVLKSESTTTILTSAACVSLGTFSVLGSVALAAHQIGALLAGHRLHRVMRFLAVILLLLGTYFFVQGGVIVYQWCRY